LIISLWASLKEGHLAGATTTRYIDLNDRPTRRSADSMPAFWRIAALPLPTADHCAYQKRFGWRPEQWPNAERVSQQIFLAAFAKVNGR